MSTELLNFKQIEKDVMMYITRNSGKTCNIYEIFNDIVIDMDIKNPIILNDLKIKLHLVMSQLDSLFNNVTVVKYNNSYLVCYNNKNIDITSQAKELVQTKEALQETFIESSQDKDFEYNLSKSVFEYIVDNDINYPINLNDNTFLQIGFMLGDTERINKLITKYNISFFNNNMLDMIESNKNTIILKYALKENNSEINKLKEANIELRRKNCELSASLIGLNAEIDKLKNNNKPTTFNIITTITILCLGYLYYCL